MKWLVSSSLLLLPLPAFACPQCVIKEQAGLGSWFILGGMMFIPMIVAGGAFLAYRMLGEDPK
jgi:hypothetical protein